MILPLKSLTSTKPSTTRIPPKHHHQAFFRTAWVLTAKVQVPGTARIGMLTVSGDHHQSGIFHFYGGINGDNSQLFIIIPKKNWVGFHPVVWPNQPFYVFFMANIGDQTCWFVDFQHQLDIGNPIKDDPRVEWVFEIGNPGWSSIFRTLKNLRVKHRAGSEISGGTTFHLHRVIWAGENTWKQCNAATNLGK